MAADARTTIETDIATLRGLLALAGRLQTFRDADLASEVEAIARLERELAALLDVAEAAAAIRAHADRATSSHWTQALDAALDRLADAIPSDDGRTVDDA